MIRFNLYCHHGHEFDAWFRSNDDYATQQESGFINCPYCDSTRIEKSLMAPAVSISSKKERVGMGLSENEREILREWRRVARTVRENAEYVGEDFAREARKIHFQETEKRAIYGEADRKDVASLIEDGIEIMPLPPLPEDQN